MDVKNEVLALLDEVLSLKGRSQSFTLETALLGAIPELDSMAVVALITSMEERFGFIVEDDEIDGAAFASVACWSISYRANWPPDLLWRWRPRRSSCLVGTGSVFVCCIGRKRESRCAALSSISNRRGNEQIPAYGCPAGVAMAAEGYLVLQIDLLGCGDSSGDFGEASWDAWVGDVVSACAWLRQQTDALMWLGLRTGCLLASVRRPGDWTALSIYCSGSRSFPEKHLQQFLRLKVAGEMLAGEGK